MNLVPASDIPLPFSDWIMHSRSLLFHPLHNDFVCILLSNGLKKKPSQSYTSHSLVREIIVYKDGRTTSRPGAPIWTIIVKSGEILASKVFNPQARNLGFDANLVRLELSDGGPTRGWTLKVVSPSRQWGLDWGSPYIYLVVLSFELLHYSINIWISNTSRFHGFFLSLPETNVTLTPVWEPSIRIRLHKDR